MTLRVLVSAYACEPGLGSEPANGWNWAFELAKAGASVWVLTVPKGKEAIDKILAETPDVDLRFVYIPELALASKMQRYPFGRTWKYVGWQARAYKVAKDLASRVEFDIVHHVSLTSLHIGSRLWRLKLPFVFGPIGGAQTAPRGYRRHLRGGWIVECMRTFTARQLSGYFLNARSTVKGSTLVLVVNRDTELAVRRLGARQIGLMTDVGIAATEISTHSPVCLSENRPLRILWVGGLIPRKGLLLALEALSCVRPSTAWHLTIVGDGPQGAILPKWLKELEIAENVKWCGAITWAEVQEKYDNADLFLFTSLRDSTGSQVLEAMSRGVPILTLNHQGVAILVPETAGIKVQVSTARETAARLATAVERLASDRSALLKMGEASIEAARSYTWDRKAKAALRIYESLLARDSTLVK
jgi:glycosyltransferase involved in cell wall biosynthesis